MQIGVRVEGGRDELNNEFADGMGLWPGSLVRTRALFTWRVGEAGVCPTPCQKGQGALGFALPRF